MLRRFSEIEVRETELTLVPLADRPAQQMRHQVLPVTDAERRMPILQHGDIDAGAVGIVDTVWTARDDESARARQFRSGRFARTDIGIDAEIPDFPRDQVAILTACIENGDLRFGCE